MHVLPETGVHVRGIKEDALLDIQMNEDMCSGAKWRHGHEACTNLQILV
jgi:hypothetical protein